MAGRALIVSYYSPPFGGIAVFRIAQLLKYLPEYGWDPVLLTASSKDYAREPAVADSTFGAVLPPTVIRTRSFDMHWLGERLKPVPARTVRHDRADGQPLFQGNSVNPWGARSRGATRLIARQVGAVVLSPDRLITWVPFAAIGSLAHLGTVDVIYAQGPPFANHIVGVLLRKISRKPLITMFEDPWIGMDHRTWYSGAQWKLQARQERWVIEQSDHVCAGTDGFRQDLITRLGATHAPKISMLHYGFDASIFADPQSISPPRNERFELVYAGSLRGEQYSPAALFEALAALRNRVPGFGRAFHLTIVGRVEERYARMITLLEIEEIVTLRGFVNHREATRAMTEATALLLIINDSRRSFSFYTSGKLYEYMGARKPILALVPSDGEAAKLVKKHHLGVVTRPGDVEAVADAILEMIDNHEVLRGGLTDCSDYASSHVVGELARVMESVTQRRRASRRGG